MGWAKFSDDAHSNEHILPLGHAAFRLWVTAIWDNRGYKDGRSPFISTARAEALCRQQRIPRRSIKDIESAGRWERTEGGWNIRNYSKYLPSRREEASDHEPDPIKVAAGKKSAALRQQPGNSLATERQQAGNALATPRAPARVDPVPVPDVSSPPDVDTPEPVPGPSKASPRSSPSPPADATSNGQADDPVVVLAVGMHELLGHVLTGQDAITCQAALNQYAYMTPELLLERARKHIAHCESQHPKLPTPRTVAGFSETWRLENDFLADHGAPKAWRPGKRGRVMASISEMLPAVAPQRDPDE